MATGSGPVVSQFFRHLDEKTGQPYTTPLRTLDEVFNWEVSRDHGSVSTVPMRSSRSESGRPRTLVCHDMAGGYLDDRFVQGVNSDEAYRFYSWSYVDVFVYFSHNFVTIPPPCWTNSGHQNGVPVLGTIITEWEDGKQLCNGFLAGVEKRQSFVEKLVSIAQFYKFDGWLVNIENEIPLDHVPRLQAFVRELSESMHASSAGSLVIWYDSVTKSGTLDWQNELNAFNEDFFHACDGIFLNYTWKEENLARSAEKAGSRISDVYVGIDVFGRGCKGGGGFNTIEALDDARSFNLSAAIFAPGWVYEKLGKANFAQNEERFWELLYPQLFVHMFTTLPISSTFSQGWGVRFYNEGNVLGTRPWTNMSVQSLQPPRPHRYVSYDVTNAFHNGGSLKIEAPAPPHPNERSIVDLFETDVLLKTGEFYYISYTYKGISSSNIALKLKCRQLSRSLGLNSHLLVDSPEDDTPEFDEQRHRFSEENCTVWPKIGKEAADALGVGTLDVTASRSDSINWKTDWFRIKTTENVQMYAVSVVLDHLSGDPVHLGGVRILSSFDMSCPKVANLSSIDSYNSPGTEIGRSQVSLTLSWNCDKQADHFIIYSLTGKEWKYLGVTTLQVFRVCNLEVIGSAVKFKVQVAFHAGLCSKFEEAPVISIVF